MTSLTLPLQFPLHKMPTATSELVSYPRALGFPVNSDLFLLATPCQEAVRVEWEAQMDLSRLESIAR